MTESQWRSLTVNLQADGGFGSSCHVDGDALVRPGIRQLGAFDGQHLAPLQQSHTSRTGQRTSIFVPSDSWDKMEMKWGGGDD